MILLKSPTALSFEQRSWMSSNNAMHTDRLLAHSLLICMLALMKYEHDGSGALRNLPVTTMPSTAHEAYVCVHGTCSGVHEKSHAKVSLLRRTAQRCLVAGSSPRGNCWLRSLPLQDAYHTSQVDINNSPTGHVRAVNLALKTSICEKPLAGRVHCTHPGGGTTEFGNMEFFFFGFE